MADISIVRPQAGQNVVLEQAPGNRLVFAFPPDAISMERVNDDMVLRFDDGGTVTLQNFYTAYTSETLPDIVVDGQTIAGEQFIAAFGDETLMPAAGPAAAAAPTGQGSSASFSDVSFLGGINRLDGLDIAFNDGPQLTETIDPAGLLETDTATDAPVADAPIATPPIATPPITSPPINIAPNLAADGTGLDVVEAGVKNLNGDPNAPFAGTDVSITGQLHATDPDNTPGGLNFFLQAKDGQSLTESTNDAGQVIHTLTTPYGTLTLNTATGTYVFTLSNTNDATQNLVQDQQLTLDFTAGVRDGLGATNTGSITVDITGTNDRPELSVSTSTINMSEDAAASSDDAGNSLTTTVTGNGNIAVSGKFDVADADADGALGTGQTITITGYEHNNTGPDASVITGQGNATGAGESSFLETTYGKFSINPATGQYTYELYNGQNGDGSNAVQNLSLGQTITETFTIRTTDAHGAWHEQTITVTVTGTNDGPLLDIGKPDHEVLVENGADQVAKGTLTVKDVDNDGTMGQQTDGKANQSFNVDGETIGIDGKTSVGTSESTTDEFGNATITTAYGTLVIKVDGTYEYTLNSDADVVQQLGKGEGITENFTVTVTDVHGATDTKTITLRVEGTNDAPVIKFNSVEVKEGGVFNGNTPTTGLDPNEGTWVAPDHHKLVVEGKLTATDADKNDTLSYDITGLKDVAGNKPANSISATVEQEDGGTRQIELHFEPTSAAAGDMGDKAFLVTAADGTVLGRLTLDSATGEFRFTLNDTSDINGLSQGEKLTFSFVTSVTDGEASADHLLQIIVRGTNDGPQLNIDQPDNAVLTEDGAAQVAKGTLTVEDADNDGTMGQQTGGKANQSFSVDGETIGIDGKTSIGTSESTTDEFGNATITTAYGTLVIKVDGTYEYTLNSNSDAVQQLGKGEGITEQFTVTVTDVHGATDTKTITLKVEGANDAPVIKFTGVEVKESGVHDGNTPTEGLAPDKGTWVDPTHHKLVVDGKLTATDADKNDSLTFDIKGLKDVTGNTLANSISATVQQEDGSSRQMDLKFETAQDHDPSDIGDKAFLVTAADGTVLGRLSLDSATGEFKFTLFDTADINGLAQGDELRFSFVTSVTDSEGASGDHLLGILVKGTNDAPQFSMSGEAVGNRVLTAYESGVWGSRNDSDYAGSKDGVNENFADTENSVLKGNVGATDADHGDKVSYSLGTGLKVGDTLATGNDHGTEVNVTIKGISTDGDWQVIETNYGTFRLNTTNGDITFDRGNPNSPEFNGLSQDFTISMNFGVTATDKLGATAQTDVTVNLVGTNDRPTLSLDTKGSLIETGLTNDGNFTITGTAFGKDTDNDNQGAQGENGLTYSFLIGGKEYTAESFGGNASAEVTINYGGQSFTGTFTLNSQTGQYSFTVNENQRDAFNDMFNSLAQDKVITLKDIATIRVTDSNASFTDQNLSVDVKGSNDRPELTPTDTPLELVVKEAGVGEVPSRPNDPNAANSGKASDSAQVAAGDVDGDKLTYFLHDSYGKEATTLFVVLNPNAENGYILQSNSPGYNGAVGTVTVDANGKVTFSINNNNSSVNALRPAGAGHPADNIHIDGLEVYVKDSHGAVADNSQTVNITITGTNERPTLTVDVPKYSFKEDGSTATNGAGKNIKTEVDKDTGDQTVNGQLKVADSDSDGKIVNSDGSYGQKFSISGYSRVEADGTQVTTPGQSGGPDGTALSFSTAYGTLTINADGSYSYTLKNGALQSLNEGDKIKETFSITTTDKYGANHTQNIVIDITGTNDIPTVSGGEEASWIVNVAEDGGKTDITNGDAGFQNTITQSGKLQAHDVDSKDTNLKFHLVDKEGSNDLNSVMKHTIEVDGETVEIGYITLQPDGSYTYTLFNDNPYVQQLAQNQKLPGDATFWVRVSDGHGGVMYKEMTVNVTGTNDTPHVEDSKSTVQEDGGLVSPDTNVPVTTTGKVQFSDIDNKEVENYKVVLNGDNAVAGSDDKGAYTEMEGQYGTIRLYENGEYTYTLRPELNNDPSFQTTHKDALFGKEHFDFTLSTGVGVPFPDGTGSVTGSITVDIVGTNDAPVITTTSGGTAATSGVAHANATETGSIAATDIDKGDQDSLHFRVMQKYENGKPVDDTYTDTKTDVPNSPWEAEQSVTGTYGTLTINPDGTYTYTLDIFSKAVQAKLAEDPNYNFKENFSVTVTDHHGATHTVQLPVEASWSKPDGSGSGGGDGGNQGHQYEFTGITDGKVELVESGSTEPGFAARLVAKGQLEVDYTCTRPEHQQGAGQGHEKGEGDFFFAFRDANGNMVQSVSDAYGTLTINPITGEYTYTLNDASGNVQQLPQGFTVGLNFPVYVVNANGQMLDAKGQVVTNPDQAFTGSITGTVTGTNDAPILDRVDSIDVDADHATDSGNSAKGHDTDKATDADGKLTDAQEALTYNYYYNGTQIMPGSSVTTEFGTFTLHADGTYAYVLAAGSDAFKGLAQGEVGYDKGFSVVASDGHSQSPAKDITVKITGENDNPTLTVKNAGGNVSDIFKVSEDGVGTVKGSLAGADVDGDTLTYSMSLNANGSNASGYLVKGTYGTMILNPNTGKFEYILNNENSAVQKLGSGDEVTETIYMTVKDGKGGSHTEAVNVTIQGTNDAAEITFGKDSGAITEGSGSQTVDLGQISITDIDASDTHTITVTFNGQSKTLTYKGSEGIEVAGKYGTLTVNPDGTYSYKLTSDALGAGQKATEDFNIVVKEFNSKGEQQGEGSSQNVSIGLTGSNDKAEVDFSVTHGSVAEGDNMGTAAVIGAVAITDLDATDYHKITVSFGDHSETLTYKAGESVDVAGKYGTLTLNPDGTYSYTLTDHSLGAGQTGSDKFQITVNEYSAKNALQGSQSQEVTIDVTGSNDKADIGFSATHADISEAHNMGTAVAIGAVAIADLDATDYHTITVSFGDQSETLTYKAGESVDVAGKYGTLTLSPDGSYSYTLTNESLGSGKTDSDIFHITVNEYNANNALQGSQAQDVVIDVTGENNVPTIAGTSVLDHSALLSDEGFSGIFDGHADGLDADGDALSYLFTYKGEALEYGQEYTADYGTIVVHENGTYTYTVTPGLELGQGGALDDSLQVQMSDALASTDPQAITVSLQQGDIQHGDAASFSLLHAEDSTDPLLLSDVVDPETDSEMDSLLAALGDNSQAQEQQPAAAPEATEAADTAHTGLDASMYDQYLVATAAQSSDDLPSAEKIAMDTIAHHGS